jgi:hypothetical protein
VFLQFYRFQSLRTSDIIIDVTKIKYMLVLIENKFSFPQVSGRGVRFIVIMFTSVDNFINKGCSINSCITESPFQRITFILKTTIVFESFTSI